MQTLDFAAQFQTQLRVQIGKRFIQQKHVGVDDEGARKGDALLLSARKLIGIMLRSVF